LSKKKKKLGLIVYYNIREKDGFKDFREHTGECPGNVRSFNFIERFGLKSVYGPHRWISHKWLSENRVWFERCSRCGAIRFWRVNDTVFIDSDRSISILRDKQRWDRSFIKKVLEEARQNP